MQKKTNIIYSFPQNTLQHIYYEFIAKFFKHEYTSINRSTENIRNGIIRKRNYSKFLYFSVHAVKRWILSHLCERQH